MRSTRRAVWCSALILLLALGCATRFVSTQEYVLDSLGGSDEETLDDGGQVEQGPIISVGPVVLPSYLRRRQIVIRSSDHTLRPSERHQWGEDLDSGITRCLAENLAALIPSDRVSRYPWPSPAPPAYRLTLEVERFEREAGHVVLKARWALSGRRSREGIAAGRAVHRVPTEGDDYAVTAAAMSRALAEMSSTVADIIRTKEGASGSTGDSGSQDPSRGNSNP